ncbi:YciI family protein [Streptomyces goshikiensis]|uniref:YciI family protein n=1 Tax=Streptomyces goshikiensis TaxID=1942 RepID=UPI00364BBE36
MRRGCAAWESSRRGLGPRSYSPVARTGRAGFRAPRRAAAAAPGSARVTWSGGKISYTDGPFTETKEVVGGYAIIQAKDKAEALEWTKRFLEIHPEQWTVGAELRQIAEG